MTVMRSFRWRLLIGSLIAGFGIFTLTPLVTFMVMQRHAITLHFLHIVAMSAVGTGCVVAGVWQIVHGLSPFDQLRERLGDVKDGRATRLEGRYPTEVQPLANELNAFLEHRERIVTRAIAKAGDLAHGLKTPLAILSREAERAEPELAAIMTQQIERMRRQVEYHLAHARAAAAGATTGAHASVLASTEGLTRALQRLYAERHLRFDLDIPESDQVRVDRVDLDEILGNLLDNACKWARSRVAVTSSTDTTHVMITVDDDGNGIAPSMREAVLQRGVRADEAAPGSGLGLAIVRELTELYGGTIALEDAPRGGVRARLSLPKL